MKVLSVSVADPPLSAARLRIERLADVLELMGHEVVRLQYSRIADESEATCSSPSHRTVIRTSSLSVWCRHLREVRSSGCDIVLAHTHRACFCALSGKLTRVPLVFDMHGDLVAETRLVRGQGSHGIMAARLISTLDMKASDMIACVSKRMMAYLSEIGIPRTRLAYVTNGVDLDSMKPPGREISERIRIELGAEDELVVGYVGGGQKWQGLDLFATAARACVKEKIKFVHLGAAGRTEAGNFIALPRISRDHVADYYSACDILVLPRPYHRSTEFAAPTKFPEYAAMAKPIITTPVGDPADYVRRYGCGLVAERCDAESLSEAIRFVAGMSKAEMDDMAKKSRKMAEEVFDWKRIGENLSESLTDLVRT